MSERLSPSEALRQALHMGVGVLAFGLADLGFVGSLGLLGFFVVFNAWLWPRFLGGRRVWRDNQGYDPGVVLYPTVLFVLLLLTRRLDIVAAVWGLLAIGDGAATVCGRLYGQGRPLPWNTTKSWPGFFGFLLFGGVAASIVLVWTNHRLLALGEIDTVRPAALLVSGGFLAALVGALVESQAQDLDDNLTAPPLAALFLLPWLETAAFWHGPPLGTLLLDFALGLGANVVLSVLAYRAGSIDRSGAIAGTAVGTVIFACLGWRGFLMLGLFFVLGSAATKVGWGRKEAAGQAQEHGGRRSARNALANVTVPAALAFFALTVGEPHLRTTCTVAFVAAFAAAAADTLSSELGQLWGRRTVMVTNLRPAPPGVDGAISLEGTLVGVGGSLILALGAVTVGLTAPASIPVVVLAGTVGNLLDSVLGATLERRGWLDNEGVNFLNTLGGALVVFALA